MPSYNLSNQNAGTPQNLSSSYKTILLATAATGAATLRRGWIYEFEIGANDVPNASDCMIDWDISFQTAAGTITALTPVPFEAVDAAAQLTYGANATAEGTVTANSSVWGIPLNQRSSQKIAFKDNEHSIIVPAVNLKGPAMRAKSSVYASVVFWNAAITE